MAVNLLIIEDNTITAMLNDHRIVSLMPCLASPKQKLADVSPGGAYCQACAAKKGGITKTAMLQARQCIISARGQMLTDLKQLLNARQLRVFIRKNSGSKTAYTL